MRLGAALLLMLFATACPPAIAQSRAPGPAPVAVASPSVHTPAKASATRIERRRAAHADARVCLEFPTQLQIVTCAEKYRWAKGS
ncbi:MAG: hypothetical protein ACREYB_07700 [Casimicrobiaceae bacterium]